MMAARCLMRNRHGSIFYARVIVPKHLRRFSHGRRDIRQSTGTTNKKEAALQALTHYLYYTEHIWGIHRQRGSPHGSSSLLSDSGSHKFYFCRKQIPAGIAFVCTG